MFTKWGLFYQNDYFKCKASKHHIALNLTLIHIYSTLEAYGIATFILFSIRCRKHNVYTMCETSHLTTAQLTGSVT